MGHSCTTASMIRTRHSSSAQRRHTTCRQCERHPSRLHTGKRCQRCVVPSHLKVLEPIACHSRTSFRSLHRRTVCRPVFTKAIATHVVAWWLWFDELHRIRCCCSCVTQELKSNPVREVDSLIYERLPNRIADIVEADCTVRHQFSSSSYIFNAK